MTELHAPGSDPSVAAFLQADHRRLDALLPEAEAFAAARDFAAAGAAFAVFHQGLARHIAMEEQVLFGVVEEVTGTGGGPTHVMRGEHREIEAHMAGMAEALRLADLDGFEAGLHGLESVLSPHNQKEERILYPMADQLLASPTRRADLVRRMQSL